MLHLLQLLIKLKKKKSILKDREKETEKYMYIEREIKRERVNE
jgi:hypothetical protein